MVEQVQPRQEEVAERLLLQVLPLLLFRHQVPCLPEHIHEEVAPAGLNLRLPSTSSPLTPEQVHVPALRVLHIRPPRILWEILRDLKS